MSNPNAGAAYNLVGSFGATALQARVSIHAQEVDTAAVSYQNTFNFYIPNANFVSPTANSTVGDLISVTLPMGDKVRLGVISAFAQLLVSYDARRDILANPNPSDRDTVRLMQRVQSVFNIVGTNGLPPPSAAFINSTDVYEIILRPVLDSLAITDIAFARELANELVNYFFTKKNRHNQSGFGDIIDYLNYRVEDFGMNLWSIIIRYALRIPIQLHHSIEDSLVPLTMAAFRAVVVIDDIFGYNLDLQITHSPVNAITVKQELSPGAPPAAVKASVVAYARTAQNLFRDAKKKWEEDHSAENDSHAVHARNYLQGLYDFVAGYHAWAQTCPRYNWCVAHRHWNNIWWDQSCRVR